MYAAAAMLAVEFSVVLSVIGIKVVFRSTAPLPCKRETPLAMAATATLGSGVKDCEVCVMENMDVSRRMTVMK